MANGWDGSPPLPVLRDLSAARAPDTVGGLPEAAGLPSELGRGVSSVWQSDTVALAVGACRMEQLRRAGAWRQSEPAGPGADSQRRIAAAEALLAERWDELAQRRRELSAWARDAAAHRAPLRGVDVVTQDVCEEDPAWTADAEFASSLSRACIPQR